MYNNMTNFSLTVKVTTTEVWEEDTTPTDSMIDLRTTDGQYITWTDIITWTDSKTTDWTDETTDSKTEDYTTWTDRTTDSKTTDYTTRTYSTTESKTLDTTWIKTTTTNPTDLTTANSPTNPNDERVCGTPSPSLRIIGGQDTDVGEWPWVGYILDGTNRFQCGAALIHNDWAVTAAHCR